MLYNVRYFRANGRAYAHCDSNLTDRGLVQVRIDCIRDGEFAIATCIDWDGHMRYFGPFGETRREHLINAGVRP
jgi:hypothetical protein